MAYEGPGGLSGHDSQLAQRLWHGAEDDSARRSVVSIVRVRSHGSRSINSILLEARNKRSQQTAQYAAGKRRSGLPG